MSAPKGWPSAAPGLPGSLSVTQPGAPGGLSTDPHRVRRIVAIGGGRGGVGKTLLSVNLAVYFAQLGRNVVICDVDPQLSSLHTTLGLDQPPLAPAAEVADGRAEPVATSVPGLKILPIPYDKWAQAPRRLSRKSQWMRPIDLLSAADYVVLNLGNSTSPAALDLFYEADVGICVAAPEPTAVETTYRFCRALFARRLRRSLQREKFKQRTVERALNALPILPTPRAIIAELGRFDEAVANVAAIALQRLRPSLLIGKSRLRRDLDLGPAMSAVCDRYLGIRLDYLGYIEQDDAVWITARRRRPLLIDAPTARSARNIERVARRVLALLAQKREGAGFRPLEASRLNAPTTLYDALNLERTAADEEIRRAYKLQQEIFREGSLPLVSLIDQEAMIEEQARIREAYDTLLDPPRRRAYDMSVFPDDEPMAVSELERGPTATAAELAQLQAELAREITPETQFTGALLKKARQALAIDIQDIARITKISPMHLRAIEAEDVAALPATVYVRGFLKQIAKSLKLDPAQVIKTYLKRVRAQADP